MKGIKVDFILDNDSWTEEEFEENQEIDREFIITEEMIINLITQNAKFELGDFIHTIVIKTL